MNKTLEQLIQEAHEGKYRYAFFEVQGSPIKLIRFHKFVNESETIIVESTHYINEQPKITYYEKIGQGVL